MSIIRVLDEGTINKIAAGEVVERPASVIKELVENAIDAGATRIEVEITAGGTSFMRVTDNGKGMTREDAELAIQRHATSKIREAGDLNTVRTLGFRGEALPTIASVSRFCMLTRPAGTDLGTKIVISGSKPPEIDEAGCSLGTTIRVEDLFFNTPARKKFLKTNHTEASHINDFIVKLALSRPDIEFQFINNNRLAVATPGNGSLFDAVQSIYGDSVADALLPLDFTDGDTKITGFISKPSTLKSSRGWQTFIVNGRIIRNGALAKAVDNAYRSLIPKSGFPFAVLVISVPQRSIDVNVHPQKSELKFEDEGRIFKAVYKTVLDAIRPADGNLQQIAATVEKPEQHAQPAFPGGSSGAASIKSGMSLFDGAAFGAKKPFDVSERSGPAGNGFRGFEQNRSAGHRFDAMSNAGSFSPSDNRVSEHHAPQTIYEAVNRMGSASEADARRFAEAQAQRLRESRVNVPQGSVSRGSMTEQANVDNQASTGGAALSGVNLSETVPNTGCSGETLRYSGKILPIGQVALTYIIAQDATGLYIVDQHAAHERILFDKFAAMADGIPSQQLLVHQILSFDRQEAELIETNKDLFSKLGFHMEPCGDREFRLMEVPADIPLKEAEGIIREILMSLQDMHRATAKEIRQACLATTACRAAIKAGEELNFRQMQILLEELASTAFPYTCPHGRPTILKFSSEELAKMFKRTGFGF